MSNNLFKKWSEEEDKILKDRYSNSSDGELSKILGRTKASIISRRSKLKLKKEKICKLNINEMMNPSTPEAAYFLGLLWADGHLTTKKYGVKISITEKDMSDILNPLLKLGDWSVKRVIFRKHPNWSPQTLISGNSKELSIFLKSLGYASKSESSAGQILSIIPTHLKHYWWRGLSDGDGCFSLSKTTSSFNIASSYNQNWDFAENLFISLGMRYSIYRVGRKTGSTSYISSSNNISVVRFGDYIYQNYEIDKIGLSRKYEKFISIKEMGDNTRKKNMTGGINKTPSGRFRAVVNLGGSVFGLGTFSLLEDALNAKINFLYEKGGNNLLEERGFNPENI